MAKKPGLMNDPKHIGGNMLNVANVMAKAAHIKQQKAGKSYLDPDQNDSDNSDSQEQSAISSPQGDHDKHGAKSPSAPAHQASQFDGELHDENSGGADHPSLGKKNKSKSQVAAISEKSKGQYRAKRS